MLLAHGSRPGRPGRAAPARRFALAALLALLALSAASAAAQAPEVPPLRGRVMDRAQLLSAEQQRELEARLAGFERESGHQIVLHTTPSLEGLDIETYSIRIAQAWKIGGAKLDDGVILTVAPAERRVRIEVGYGLEGALPDALAARIVRERMTPAFARGDWAGGIEAGMAEILRLTGAEPGSLPPAPSERRGAQPSALLYLLLLLLVFAGPHVFPALFGSAGARRRRVHHRGGFVPPFGGGFGGFGGGSGGGGGFGGRGGGFGGGGASGSW